MSKRGWRLVWAGWLLFLIISFAVLEALAWKDGLTLSRFVWELSETWPLIIFIAGSISGVLAAHFWWREGG